MLFVRGDIKKVKSLWRGVGIGMWGCGLREIRRIKSIGVMSCLRRWLSRGGWIIRVVRRRMLFKVGRRSCRYCDRGGN